jgi:hypothetical protein
MAASYPQEVARAKQAGLPLTMRHWQAPLPPASRNAAPLYGLMTNLLKARPIGTDQTLLADFLRDPSPARREAVQALLDRYAHLLRLAHEAAARPECVFTRDWDNTNPVDILYPELATIRTTARLLTAESLLLAGQGKRLDAVQNEAVGFRLARHSASDNTLAAYLVGIAVDAITVDGLRQILSLSASDPQAALAVQTAIEQEWRPRSLSAALRSEVATMQDVVASIRRQGPRGFSEGFGAEFGKATGTSPDLRLATTHWQIFLDANAAYLLRQMPKMVAAADQPYPDAYPTIQAIMAEIKSDEHADAKTMLPHFLAILQFPVYEQVFPKRAAAESQAQVVRVGAALLAYQAAHGAFPEQLDTAVSPVPPDPFTGQPLRYRREGTGFVVYSVGPTGTFDGGKPTAKLTPREAELVYRYPPASSAAPTPSQ